MARVLLLFGGRSAEHEVSCVSAVAVAAALESSGHHVILVGIDKNGSWHLAQNHPDRLEASGPRAYIEVPDASLVARGQSLDFDVAFPVLHGPHGEDGTIQGLFEISGIPYVGCGVLASAMAMDKDIAKRLVQQQGIATPEWRVVCDSGIADLTRSVTVLSHDLGLPAFVKPAQLGSSVGVTRAESESQLKEALEVAFRFGSKALVEEAILGREIEVAVLEGPRASVPGEIFLRSGWYDYEAKYEDGTGQLVVPAELSDKQMEQVQALACEVFSLLECSGLARIDFLLDSERGFLFNEINTMPGFTPISGFPKMWEASGLTYSKLCNELVNLAFSG